MVYNHLGLPRPINKRRETNTHKYTPPINIHTWPTSARPAAMGEAVPGRRWRLYTHGPSQVSRPAGWVTGLATITSLSFDCEVAQTPCNWFSSGVLRYAGGSTKEIIAVCFCAFIDPKAGFSHSLCFHHVGKAASGRGRNGFNSSFVEGNFSGLVKAVGFKRREYESQKTYWM